MNDTHIFDLSNQGFSGTTGKIGETWRETILDRTLRSWSGDIDCIRNDGAEPFGV